MRMVTLGAAGIATPQNAFGALSIQRVDRVAAVRILRKVRDGGMTCFDTARACSDSIGITAHKISIAAEEDESGLYETLKSNGSAGLPQGTTNSASPSRICIYGGCHDLVTLTNHKYFLNKACPHTDAADNTIFMQK